MAVRFAAPAASVDACRSEKFTSAILEIVSWR
jgi:hypothetical protein